MRENKQKAKAEAEGRTYTKHEKTAQRTAEIVKEDREKARPKELEEYKEGLRDVLSERFGPVRHVTDMTPDQRILQAQTNILENQKKMAQARTDKREGLAEDKRLGQARKKAEREEKAAAKRLALVLAVKGCAFPHVVSGFRT